MKILLVNVPHPAIGSRIPDDHLPPLGLLAIGGPLIDDGHAVSLIDAEFGPVPLPDLVREIVAQAPEAVLFGHSGSTSGHPVIAEVSSRVAAAMPGVTIVYGGVFPTYHGREILEAEPHVAAIVRGEGEETARRLMAALAAGRPLGTVPGLAYRDGDAIRDPRDGAGPADPRSRRLPDRLGADRPCPLQLLGRPACGRRPVLPRRPHPCTYCGQRGFWTRWRHRDPVRFAAELARLHREHGVRVINFADENPTVSKKVWRTFLEALIAENVDLILVGSTRADDIVRDADILPLYKRAGWERFLLGLESTDTATLDLIRKGATTTTDREAIRLLRANGILSMATWVVGFEEERDRDYWRGLRQLLAYDPDQIQMLYVTPHRWTPYFRLAEERRVIQLDRRRWDYKHQVLATRHMPPWRVLLWFKLIEVILQARPKALARIYLNRDPRLRHAMRWYTRMGRRVWPHEILAWLRDPLTRTGPTVAAFWGRGQEREEAMAVRAAARSHPAGREAA